MSDWIDELFDGEAESVQIDWKTQSLLIRMLEESVLSHDEEIKSLIINGRFTRQELDKIFIKLTSHKKQLSENPSQTEISKFIKNHLL